MRKFILYLIAANALAPVVRVEPVYAVRPIDCYVCMKLNVTEAEVLKPHGTGIFLLVAPRADATPGTIDRLLKAGARGYLPKPLDVEQFLRTIDEMLETE